MSVRTKWVLGRAQVPGGRPVSRGRVALAVLVTLLGPALGSAADPAAPRVVHAFPEAGGWLPAGAALLAAFSAPVDPATVGPSTFVLTPPAAGVVTYDAPSRTAIFRPTGALTAGQPYTAILTNGIRDLRGDALPEAFSWVFYASDQPDATPPQVIAAVPEGGASGVPRNRAVQLAFSEDLDPTTVTAGSVRLDGGAAGAFRYHAPSRTATFYPDQPLAADEVYTVTVTAALSDTSGNGLAAPAAWQFRTGGDLDAEPPAVVQVSPPDGAAWAAVVPPFAQVTFSEAVDATTLDAGSFLLTPGEPGEVGYTVGERTATLLVAPSYDVATRATVTPAVRDLAGNSLAREVSWSFTVTRQEIVFDCEQNPDLPGCGSDTVGGCFLRELGRAGVR